MKAHQDLDHNHKKRKDSLETRPAFSLILVSTRNFWGCPNNFALTLFKIASARRFWCSYNHTWLLDMLVNDNIISANVSEAVEKIPTDMKKIIANVSLCDLVCIATT